MTHSVSDSKKNRLHLSHNIVHKCSSSTQYSIYTSTESFRVNKLIFSEHFRVFMWTLWEYHDTFRIYMWNFKKERPDLKRQLSPSYKLLSFTLKGSVSCKTSNNGLWTVTDGPENHQTSFYVIGENIDRNSCM